MRQDQLQERKRLIDEQAAVIDKLKMPLLDMTSALQQMQSKKQEIGQELLEVCACVCVCVCVCNQKSLHTCKQEHTNVRTHLTVCHEFAFLRFPLALP